MKDISASVNKTKKDGEITDSYMERLGDSPYYVGAIHTGMMLRRQEEGVPLDGRKGQFAPELLPTPIHSLLGFGYYQLSKGAQTKAQEETIEGIKAGIKKGTLIPEKNGRIRFSDKADARMSKAVQFAIQNQVYIVDLELLHEKAVFTFRKKGFTDTCRDLYVGFVYSEHDPKVLATSVVKWEIKAYKDAKNKGFEISFADAIIKATKGAVGKDGAPIIDTTEWNKKYPSSTKSDNVTKTKHRKNIVFQQVVDSRFGYNGAQGIKIEAKMLADIKDIDRRVLQNLEW